MSILSHFRKALHWVTNTLGLSSPKVWISPVEERAAMTKAMQILTLIKDHKYEEALSHGTSTIKLLLSPGTLEKALKDLPMGNVVSFKSVGVEKYGKNKIAKVTVKFEKGELLAVVTIDSAGLISGFRLKPSTEIPWKQPTYVDPTLFKEEDITLTCTNKVNVESSLSLPKTTPTAGIIFLSGSGPTDKDSTIGPNKPLKDLAWGLASKNIAVLRWSKPTTSDADASKITLEKEYLPYALAAISHLREKLETSSIPIFVLGHSLGGMVAPMVAAADPSIKGLILMAAGGGKMYDSALRQVQYLSCLETKPLAISQEYINLLIKQVALIESGDLNENTPEEDLLFGAPALYWLSVKEYDEIAAAKSLTVPISILQPGRDYQVTVEDDFMKWKEGLEGKENVDMKVYEGLDHLFIHGEGVSNAEDYAVEGHVDEGIIRDICAWIEAHSQA